MSRKKRILIVMATVFLITGLLVSCTGMGGEVTDTPVETPEKTILVEPEDEKPGREEPPAEGPEEEIPDKEEEHEIAGPEKKKPDGEEPPAEKPEEEPSVKEPEEELPEDTEDQQLISTGISVVLTPQILPEGGGQTATIAVTVTDKAGNPVEGAKVVFRASAFESGERNAQLSQPETTTDASGKAMATYTSLVADDKKMVEILVSAFKDPDLEQHKKYKIMASNQAAVVCGVVRDPYTGAPKKDVCICFISSETMKSVGCIETDDQGRYSMIVPTGIYHMNFEMAIRDSITVNVNSSGQTYTVNNNKGILKGVVTGASPGNMVMALAPGFRHNHDAWTLRADIQSDGSFTLALAPDKYELFIVGKDTPFKTGVTVQSGQITDIGTVSAR